MKKGIKEQSKGNHVSRGRQQRRNSPDAHLIPILLFRVLAVAGSSPLDVYDVKVKRPPSIASESASPSQSPVVDRLSRGHGGPHASGHAGVAEIWEVVCRRRLFPHIIAAPSRSSACAKACLTGHSPSLVVITPRSDVSVT